MGETVLELDDLTVRFRLKRGDLTAVNGVSFCIGRGETFGLVGEFGLGQVGDGAGDHAADPRAARRDRARPYPVRRRERPRQERRRDARAARPADRHGVPGADERAQSGVHGARPDLRRAALQPQAVEGRGARAGRRAIVAGRHPLAAQAARQLRPRVLGRHAPARHAGDGAELQPVPADRRRADHRARRHHPGAPSSS